MPRYKVKYNFKNDWGVNKTYDHIVVYDDEEALVKAMKDGGISIFEYVEVKEKKEVEEPTIEELVKFCDKKSGEIIYKIHQIIFERTKDKLSDSEVNEINGLLLMNKRYTTAYYDLPLIVAEYKEYKESE